MPRTPRDINAELQDLQERTKKLKLQRIGQLGELVQATGADALPVNALTGALLAVVEQSRKDPSVVRRWTACGEGFFRDGSRRGRPVAKPNPSSSPGGVDANSAGAATVGDAAG